MGQMIASAVGVFLYRKHFAEEGWYPTFMPLVSIVPGVILMMGGGFWLSLTIAVLAGISAAPVGSYIAKRLPPFVPRCCRLCIRNGCCNHFIVSRFAYI